MTIWRKNTEKSKITLHRDKLELDGALFGTFLIDFFYLLGNGLWIADDDQSIIVFFREKIVQLLSFLLIVVEDYLL